MSVYAGLRVEESTENARRLLFTRAYVLAFKENGPFQMENFENIWAGSLAHGDPIFDSEFESGFNFGSELCVARIIFDFTHIIVHFSL